MDPIAIVGLTATTAKLIQLCISSAKGLHDLYAVQRRSEKALLSIERECLTLRAAVEGIEVWSKSKNAKAIGRQALVNSLNDALQALIPSIEVLSEDVERMLKTMDRNGKLSVTGKVSYVWGKKEMAVMLDELRWQSQHVHTLISVINMPTDDAQSEIGVLQDNASEHYSIPDGGLSALDRELMNTAPYRRTLLRLPTQIPKQTIRDALPDTPKEPTLIKSYRNGSILEEVDKNAPTIKIGITFMDGTDRETILESEQSMSDNRPIPKLAEWKVHTAATLLFEFEVGHDLGIAKRDNSQTIIDRIKRDVHEIESISGRRFSQEEDHSTKPTNEIKSDLDSSSQPKRAFQDHVLNIDSDEVQLLHAVPARNSDFQLSCTLIEVDHMGLINLLSNLHGIIRWSAKKLNEAERKICLDSVIVNVRLFHARSPRLFRMTTRSVIARSGSIRYGVDLGNSFMTVTTSGGIRRLIELSCSYFLSLDSHVANHGPLKSEFLQMLIFLLSLLTEEDLQVMKRAIEVTFQIPMERAYLELLILKILPLESATPAVFLEGLLAARKPSESRYFYDDGWQEAIWREFQRDIVQNGFILPSFSNPEISLSVEKITDQMDGLSQKGSHVDGGEGSFNRQPKPSSPSWMVQWPRDGISSSEIFRHLQHDGKLRGPRKSTLEDSCAFREIPRLEFSSDERTIQMTAKFENNIHYKVLVADLRHIEDMKPGQYRLWAIEDSGTEPSYTLEIKVQVLNERFIDATIQLNSLFEKINASFSDRAAKRSLKERMFSKRDSPPTFTQIDVPDEMNRLRAEIVNSSGDRETISVMYKWHDREVSKSDIIRDMKKDLSNLAVSVDGLEKELRQLSGSKTSAQYLKENEQQHVDTCYKMLNEIRTISVEEDQTTINMAGTSQSHEVEGCPIQEIIPCRSNLSSEHAVGWHDYQSQLSESGEALLILAQWFTVEAAECIARSSLRLRFSDYSKTIEVERLSLDGASDMCPLSVGDAVLWLGYYLVAIRPAPHTSIKNGQEVLSWLRVVSEGDRNSGTRARRKLSNDGKVRISKHVLV